MKCSNFKVHTVVARGSNFQAAMKKSTPEATETSCAWFKKIEGASRKDAVRAAVVRVSGPGTGPAKPKDDAAVIGGPGPVPPAIEPESRVEDGKRLMPLSEVLGLHTGEGSTEDFHTVATFMQELQCMAD